jgi:cell fate (sporulation/competence/biofilm development) regulator YlbF (YheA/YmcA/DUF963 family)
MKSEGKSNSVISELNKIISAPINKEFSTFYGAQDNPQ